MRSYLLLTTIWLLVALWPAAVAAQPADLPREGLSAEMAGRWEEALDVYSGVLAEDPGNVEIWLRVADIRASLELPEEAAEALAVAATLSPTNPRIHFRSSQAYSMSDQPELALAAVGHAIELAPDNVTYLETQARLAQ